MKIVLSLHVTLLLLGGVSISNAQSSQPVQTLPPPFSITIRAVNEFIQSRSPVVVETTVKNTSDRQTVYASGGPIYYKKFDVRDSAGNQPLTRRGRALLLGEGLSTDDFPRGSQRGEVLGPGESITVQERVPSDIFDMSNPGTYSIQLRQPWGKEWMKSNTVTVTVIPADAAHLEAAAKIPTRQPPIAVMIKTAGGLSAFSGTPVALEVTTKNISNHFTNQRTARDKKDLQRFYRVDVQDSQGATPPETDFGRSVGNRGDVPPHYLGQNAAPGHEDVRHGSYLPGDERTEVITVNDLYDLSKPGQYTIQVRRWDDETKTWVKSNTITVTVTP